MVEQKENPGQSFVARVSRRRKWLALAVVLAVFVGFGIVVGPRLEVPYAGHVRQRLATVKKRFILTCNHTGRIPQSIADLEPVEGADDSVTNKWGYPPKITAIFNGSDALDVTVTDYGSDNREGGTGDAKDRAIHFRLKKMPRLWIDPDSIDGPTH